jgi:hypothetical protein
MGRLWAGYGQAMGKLEKQGRDKRLKKRLINLLQRFLLYDSVRFTCNPARSDIGKKTMEQRTTDEGAHDLAPLIELARTVAAIIAVIVCAYCWTVLIMSGG